MLDVILDTLIDVVKIIPFLFLTYLAMEYLEHKTGDRTQELVRKAGHFGPLLGGLFGILPQCGFSTAGANFYAGGVITVGTLIAIFLSTSDEMLPILISEQAPIDTILKILLGKAVIGIFFGFLIDFVRRAMVRKRRRELGLNDALAAGSQEVGKESHHEHNHAEHEHGTHESHDHKHLLDIGDLEEEPHTHIHDICEHEHCDCEEHGILYSAFSHTLQISFFILIITFALNLLFHLVGEESLGNILTANPLLGPVLSSLIGLIPNCAGSVAITQLYLEGVISTGSMMAGLLTGSGVGILVLFRVNRNKKRNMEILGLLYLIGVFCGIVIDLFV